MDYYPKTEKHMTCWELMAILSGLDQRAPLFVDDPAERIIVEQGIHSYRGYYEDMELETYRAGENETLLVEDLHKAMWREIGTTVEGWKGGDYDVSERAFLWLGTEGDCQQQALTAVHSNENGSYSLITTKIEF